MTYGKISHDDELKRPLPRHAMSILHFRMKQTHITLIHAPNDISVLDCRKSLLLGIPFWNLACFTQLFQGIGALLRASLLGYGNIVWHVGVCKEPEGEAGLGTKNPSPRLEWQMSVSQHAWTRLIAAEGGRRHLTCFECFIAWYCRKSLGSFAKAVLC